MAEEAVTNARPTRERKPTQRLEPAEGKLTGNKPFAYSAGDGKALGEISYFRQATDSMASDDELLMMLHSLFFGSAGKGTMRKRQIRSFKGFPADGPSHSSLVDKISKSKKWTVAHLKNAAGLFGIDKGGSREDIIGKLVDYIMSPTDIDGVPTSVKKSRKRKAGAKGKKTKKEKKEKGEKRALTPYILFTQAKRATVKEENPEASFGEISKILGGLWKKLSDAEKEVWVSAAAAAAGTEKASTGGKKKRQKKEKGEETVEEEDGDDETEDDGDEEEGDDDDEEED